MVNPVHPTTYLAEAADAATWQSVRLASAGFPRRSGYDTALVERQMR